MWNKFCLAYSSVTCWLDLRLWLKLWLLHKLQPTSLDLPQKRNPDLVLLEDLQVTMHYTILLYSNHTLYYTTILCYYAITIIYYYTIINDNLMKLLRVFLY